MAYVPQQLPEDEKNQFGRTGQTTPQPVPPQGGGSSGTGTNAAPGQATSTQFGSNAAKLSDYLNANKDQVQQFGQQVAGNLSQGYQNTMGAIDQGFGSFNQQVGQGYTPANQDLTSRAAANPTEFVKDPNNVSSFRSLYNDTYSGPQSFEETPVYQNLNDQVNKAVENAGLVNSFSGLKSYLNNNLGTANNTPGMQTLDTALLQRSPEASQAIQAAAQPYSGLTDYLGGKAKSADEGVAKAKTEASNIAQSLRDQYTGANGILPTFQGSLQQRYQDMANQQNQVNAKYQNLTSASGLPDLDTLVSLGVPQDQAQQMLKTAGILSSNYADPLNQVSNYVQFTPGQVATPETVASSDDFARAQALAQLTGTDPFLNPTMASSAGTASLPQLGYDYQRAGSELGNTLTQDDQHLIASLPNLTSDIMRGVDPYNSSYGQYAGVPVQTIRNLVDALYRTGAMKVPTGGTYKPGDPVVSIGSSTPGVF